VRVSLAVVDLAAGLLGLRNDDHDDGAVTAPPSRERSEASTVVMEPPPVAPIRQRESPPAAGEPLKPAPVHVSAEPELVSESADAGAEEGAGAQIRIGEPWEGYRAMKAADVINRLSTATKEELAAVELYEVAGRNRKSVVAAAHKALRLASPPR
jgi:hypothetical protein